MIVWESLFAIKGTISIFQLRFDFYVASFQQLCVWNIFYFDILAHVFPVTIFFLKVIFSSYLRTPSWFASLFSLMPQVLSKCRRNNLNLLFLWWLYRVRQIIGLLIKRTNSMKIWNTKAFVTKEYITLAVFEKKLLKFVVLNCLIFVLYLVQIHNFKPGIYDKFIH